MPVAVGASLLEEEISPSEGTTITNLLMIYGEVPLRDVSPYGEAQDAWDVVSFLGGYVHMSRCPPEMGPCTPTFPLPLPHNRGGGSRGLVLLEAPG